MCLHVYSMLFIGHMYILVDVSVGHEYALYSFSLLIRNSVHLLILCLHVSYS